MKEDIFSFSEKLKFFRQNRRNRTQKMPIELKREAVFLLKKYGYKRINEVCPVGNSTLYKWKSEIEADGVKIADTKVQALQKPVKKKLNINISHTRLNVPKVVDAESPQNPTGCLFKIGNIQFCIDDPVFLAQAIHLLQVRMEERL